MYSYKPMCRVCGEKEISRGVLLRDLSVCSAECVETYAARDGGVSTVTWICQVCGAKVIGVSGGPQGEASFWFRREGACPAHSQEARERNIARNREEVLEGLANPASLEEILAIIRQMPGGQWLVSARYHQQAWCEILDYGWDDQEKSWDLTFEPGEIRERAALAVTVRRLVTDELVDPRIEVGRWGQAFGLTTVAVGTPRHKTWLQERVVDAAKFARSKEGRKRGSGAMRQLNAAVDALNEAEVS